MLPRTIAFIGDLHCGSHCGLWPTEDLPGGIKGTKYKGVRYLNKCYQHMIQNWPEIDLLVLMGDLIDGKQRKSSGVGIFTSSLNEQVSASIEILKPLKKKSKKIVRVFGTPYHEDHDNCLDSLDKALDVKKVDQVLNIEIDKKILNVAHHPSGGSALYAGTSVDKESLWSTIAAAEKNVPNARWIVRAHKHMWIMQETRFKMVCIVPCFELPTFHAIKVNYWRFQPSIGGMLMTADKSHDSGYRFTASTYDVPIPEIYNVEHI